MKRKKKIIVEKEIDAVESIICDVCKIIIPLGSNNIYFEVSTRHNHWGNDSYESIEQFDLCSRVCLSAHMNNYFNESDDDNGYFYDIETERA